MRAKTHLIFFEGNLAGNPVIRRFETVPDHRAKGFFGDLAEGFAGIRITPNNHSATTRHEIDEALESQLVHVEISVNVGMIEFHGSNDQVVGSVVEEFS